MWEAGAVAVAVAVGGYGCGCGCQGHAQNCVDARNLNYSGAAVSQPHRYC